MLRTNNDMTKHAILVMVNDVAEVNQVQYIKSKASMNV